MTPAQANNTIAAENMAGTQVRPLFPPDFIYQPPVEQLCGCGQKHTGHFRNCSVCQSAESRRGEML